MYVETQVSSSFIEAIGYEDRDRLITVTFHDGSKEEYPGSRDLFDEFVQSRSKGRFWHTRIKVLGGTRV